MPATMCPACSAVLEENALFCTKCGAKIQPVPANETHFCMGCGAILDDGTAYCAECGKPIETNAPVAPQVTPPMQVTPPPEDKRIPRLPLMLGGAAVAVVALVAAVFLLFFKGSAETPYILYGKDNQLQYTQLPNAEPFEVTSRLIGSSDIDFNESFLSNISAFVQTSADGRYMFYPDRVEYDEGATYYYRDLKGKDGEAVKVDSEIHSPGTLTKDGSKFFYTKGSDNRFYVFDRKTGESAKLDNDVNSYYVNDAGNYAIYTKYIDGENSLYEVTINGLESEKEKIDSAFGLSLEEVQMEQKKVLYFRDEALYLKEQGKDREKLASGVFDVLSVVNGSSVYYLKSTQIKTPLSELIQDDMLAEDNTLKMPDNPVYPAEPDDSNAPEYPDISDYEQGTWVADDWYNTWNPDTEEFGYWEPDYDAYDAAVAQYETDYEVWLDTYNTSYQAWMTEYERIHEEYQIACQKYETKAFRDELRAEMKNDAYALANDEYALYYWENGTETLLGNNCYDYALASSSTVPLLVYQKYADTEKEMPKLSDFQEYYYYSIESVLSELQYSASYSRKSSEETFVAAGATEVTIDCAAGRYFDITDDGTIYFLDEVDDYTGKGALVSASVTNGTVSTPIKIDDDVDDFFLSYGKDEVYYLKDMKNYTGDLYYSGGKIASDVYRYNLYSIKDSDTLLYYTDYSDNRAEGSLNMFKKGVNTKISDDVHSFVPIDENNIVYLIDYSTSRYRGDLMLFRDGKAPVSIDTDVNGLIFPSQLRGRRLS